MDGGGGGGGGGGGAAAVRAVVESDRARIIKPGSTSLLPEENQLLENGLRALLQGLVSKAVAAGEPVMQYGRSIAEGEDSRGLVTKLLDITLYLCEHQHVEGGLVFTLLEDTTEYCTIADCKEVFAFIESKQDTLGKVGVQKRRLSVTPWYDLLYCIPVNADESCVPHLSLLPLDSNMDLVQEHLSSRGKLLMLRTCNLLLRRLSKTYDVVFCGRILMFLTHFFPLSERSGVNVKGAFNTSNITASEKEPPAGCLACLLSWSRLDIDFQFYTTFWSLQETFCNPPALLASARWQNFSTSLTTVLTLFEEQPLEEEQSKDGLEDGTYKTKFLTSTKLMALELRDPSFRRHVLVQCLILFDFIKNPPKVEKENEDKREILKEEAGAFEDRVKRLLQSTPPRGFEFLKSVEHVLSRERNWVLWKRETCPAFGKEPTESPLTRPEPPRKKPRGRMGNRALDQLDRKVQQLKNVLTDPDVVKVPTMAEYFQPLAEDLDPDSGIETEYSHAKNQVYCWRGLRLAARQDIAAFSRFSDLGIEGVVPKEMLVPQVHDILYAKAVAKPKAPATKAAAAAAAPSSSPAALETKALEVINGKVKQSSCMDEVAPCSAEIGSLGDSGQEAITTAEESAAGTASIKVSASMPDLPLPELDTPLPRDVAQVDDNIRAQQTEPTSPAEEQAQASQAGDPLSAADSQLPSVLSIQQPTRMEEATAPVVSNSSPMAAMAKGSLLPDSKASLEEDCAWVRIEERQPGRPPAVELQFDLDFGPSAGTGQKADESGDTPKMRHPL
eukprot:SM000024S07854  [mRNA]  locus=s24:961254:967299:+ [translate_table: standard]